MENRTYSSFTVNKQTSKWIFKKKTVAIIVQFLSVCFTAKKKKIFKKKKKLRSLSPKAINSKT